MALMLVSGCAHHVRVTTVTEVRTTISSEPTTMIYVGSDADYHYIDHQTSGGMERMRVRRSELILPRTFPLGQGQPYHLTAADLRPVSP